jgi:hypothetical protein
VDAEVEDSWKYGGCLEDVSQIEARLKEAKRKYNLFLMEQMKKENTR